VDAACRTPHLPVYRAGLIEEELIPGAFGVVGGEIEFIPKPVQLLLPLFVEDQPISAVSSR
jgi:hypothetical protein